MICKLDNLLQSESRITVHPLVGGPSLDVQQVHDIVMYIIGLVVPLFYNLEKLLLIVSLFLWYALARCIHCPDFIRLKFMYENCILVYDW